MMTNPQHSTAPIPPALVAAAFDCLAFMPNGDRLEPSILIAVTRTITADKKEADALLVRIRAAAIVLRDPRWPHWSAYFKSATPDTHRAFDAIVLDLVATLPLGPSLRFPHDVFFETLLARVPVTSCN